MHVDLRRRTRLEQGLSIWKEDVMGFLDEYVRGPRP